MFIFTWIVKRGGYMPDIDKDKKDKSHVLRIGLAGNPNCGKTTVFNGYTGTHQHVGNYPGVTVEKKESQLKFEGRNIILIDLPGIYSITPYSQEEIAARDELMLSNMQTIIDVVEASALERGLLLTVQLLEMGMPVVVACNMMDEAKKAGIQIDMPLLAKRLNAPVFPMVAKNEEGLKDVLADAVKLAEGGNVSLCKSHMGLTLMKRCWKWRRPLNLQDLKTSHIMQDLSH